MTTTEIVKRIYLLRRWEGKALSPTPHVCDFAEYFGKLVKCPDFQSFNTDYKFQAVIGILPLAYISKSLDLLDKYGELIVCTPTLPDLAQKLYRLGTITDVIHHEEQVIWRFVKDDFSHRTLVDGCWKHCVLMNNQLMFLNKDHSVPFTDLFTIHVGAISGLDEAFINKKGDAEFVTSQTAQTGMTKRMFFNTFDESMVKFKKKLLARRVKKFSQDNWWTWGRSHYISDKPRVYVPCKTQQEHPFFHHESNHYDGTILAIFFKNKMKPAKVVNLLNKVDWTELGFKVGKRYIFSQKSLESIRLPKDFMTICT